MTQTGPSALRAISEALVNYCEYDGPFLGYILGVEYDEDGETSLWEQVSAEYDTTAETSLYSTNLTGNITKMKLLTTFTDFSLSWAMRRPMRK